MFSERARLAAKVLENWACDEPEEEDPADCGEEDVEDDEARRGVGEGDGESEEDPADDVVCETGS